MGMQGRAEAWDTPERSHAGSYPGGPTGFGREASGKRARYHALTRSGETVEGERDSFVLRRTKSKRLQRRLSGVLLFLMVGLGVGLHFGLESVVSAEELARATQATAQSFDPSREVSRLLVELWKMEDLEVQRGPLAGRR